MRTRRPREPRDPLALRPESADATNRRHRSSLSGADLEAYNHHMSQSRRVAYGAIDQTQADHHYTQARQIARQGGDAWRERGVLVERDRSLEQRRIDYAARQARRSESSQEHTTRTVPAPRGTLNGATSEDFARMDRVQGRQSRPQPTMTTTVVDAQGRRHTVSSDLPRGVDTRDVAKQQHAQASEQARRANAAYQAGRREPSAQEATRRASAVSQSAPGTAAEAAAHRAAAHAHERIGNKETAQAHRDKAHQATRGSTPQHQQMQTQRGPRGGEFYMKNGRKVYVKK